MKQSSLQKRRIATRALALCAIFSALGVVFLYFGAVVEVFDLTMAALSSLLVIMVVIEMRGGYPWMLYAVTSLLSLLLLPNKLPAFFYLFFAGVYPILKAYFERLPVLPAWIVKFAFFNAMLTFLLFLVNQVLHLPDTGLEAAGITYLLGNILFGFYDFFLTAMITLYLRKIRDTLHLQKYFSH